MANSMNTSDKQEQQSNNDDFMDLIGALLASREKLPMQAEPEEDMTQEA